MIKLARNSVVNVYFSDMNKALPYYNDKFDLKVGDHVFVEGAYEGILGRVTQISYSFKIKADKYKKVISVADTNIHGSFKLLPQYVLTSDREALTYEKFLSWVKPPSDEEYIVSYSDESFTLDSISHIDIDTIVMKKASSYYNENKVLYLELCDGRVRAIVEGSEIYEVEFLYKDGKIISPLCDCYYLGVCKHIYASVMLFDYLLKEISNKYPNIEKDGYFAAALRSSFMDITANNENFEGSINI